MNRSAGSDVVRCDVMRLGRGVAAVVWVGLGCSGGGPMEGDASDGFGFSTSARCVRCKMG